MWRGIKRKEKIGSTFVNGASGEYANSEGLCQSVLIRTFVFRVLKSAYVNVVQNTSLIRHTYILIDLFCSHLPRTHIKQWHSYMCAQRKLRSVCASAQADLSLRCAPEEFWILGCSRGTLRRLWSDTADDLSLLRVNMQSCGKCCVPAHFFVGKWRTYGVTLTS